MSATDIKLPWDYTPLVDPDSPTAKPNLPTPEGVAFGAELARLTEPLVEEFPEVPLRCGECVFRRGTAPNGCVPTLADAFKAAMEGDHTFVCIHVPGKEGTACAGWLLWRKAAERSEQG